MSFRLILQVSLLVSLLAAWGAPVAAQQPPSAASPLGVKPEEKRLTAPLPPTPEKVDVQPLANDDEIAGRLTAILFATEWFQNARVEVRQGVAFLYGDTATQQYKDWATELARNTQDVAAVVNRIAVRESSVWDLTPVWSETEAMWRRTLAALPYLLLGLIVLSLSLWGAGIGARIARRTLATRLEAPLLREVAARLCGAVIVLMGIYFVLRIYGLTRLAVTILGGTGLVGLVLGIAFRDISENFLASIFLSIQRPFRAGDLVQIASETGYVQRLNARTTILMTLDGNSIQIPNATVYKSPITNFMSNPNRRESFTIGIGYREILSDAQAYALKVLLDHPAVLKDPEPWVLVDGLTPDLINLKVYYWINGRDHSFIKVRSSLIRLIKATFQEHGIRLPAAPGAALAVTQLDTALTQVPAAPPSKGTTRARSRERTVFATRAEGGLDSEEREIQNQADLARPAEDGGDLLKREPVAPEDGSQTEELPEAGSPNGQEEQANGSGKSPTNRLLASNGEPHNNGKQ